MKWNVFMLFLIVVTSCKQQTKNPTATQNQEIYNEKFRPQYHFSPPTGWMNDPNGLVYNDGVYHLFYQYYPNATIWGPMHWGHAVSEDLIQWENRPIALYPDEHGFIFSGSAVVDKNNTSGFGREGISPLVAIFTYHDMAGEKAGRKDFQTQGIAYSLDNGESWIKYDGNPVIGNETIRDFRDPKVFWHESSKSWILVLVAGDHAKLYRSQNLKQFSHISDFGKNQGAHGGVWECPDLFPLKVEGTDEVKWVMIISIGGGAPNGGSGTQYFVGDFDGTTFTTEQETYKWLDWGTDNYAGVTYNDVPDAERKFIGWMSNWQYAPKTPSDTYRSAMTLPRKLSLKRVGGEIVLNSYPVDGLHSIHISEEQQEFVVEAKTEKTIAMDGLGESKVSFRIPKNDFAISFANASGNRLKYIYDAASKLLILDRTESGIVDFNYDFGNKLHYMPLVDNSKNDLQFEVFLDRSSSELFLNGGEQVMTQQVFPETPFDSVVIENLSDTPLKVEDFSMDKIESIWQ